MNEFVFNMLKKVKQKSGDAHYVSQSLRTGEGFTDIKKGFKTALEKGRVAQ